MTKHAKHDDILDVQVRTKFLDEYGNEMTGVVEYDPATGFGKRIADPQRGLIEPFFRKGGSVEIDGHNFDETNQDDAVVEGVKSLITLKVNRGQPEYDDLLKQHINLNRNKDKQEHPSGPKTEPTKADKLPKIIAKTQIAAGEEIEIDVDKGEATGTRSKNVFSPQKDDAITRQWADSKNPNKAAR